MSEAVTSPARAAAAPRLDLGAPEDLSIYVAACMDVSGARLDPWYQHCLRANSWFAHLLNHGFERVPYFLVHDLGLLILRDREFPFRLLATDTADAREGAARTLAVAYQNRVINRVLTMPRFAEACLLAQQDDRDDGKLLYLLEHLLRPMRDAPLPAIVAATTSVRALSMHGAVAPPQARAALALRLPSLAHDAHDPLAAQLRAVTQVYDSVPGDGLLGPEDLFVLHHFAALASRADRLAMRHVATLEAAFDKAAPIPRRWRDEVPHVPVALDDIGLFPQGGLDGLATRGSLENLVQSELALIQDDSPIDLFSLRFLEGEMLYYTRDEGQLMRRMRALHVVLDLEPFHTVHYPEHPARFAVLVQAMVHRCVEELLEVFRDASLMVRLHACRQNHERVAWGWRVRFAERVAHNDVRVFHQSTAADLDSPRDWRIPGRANTMVYLGGASPPSPAVRERAFRQGLAIFWCQLRDSQGPVGGGDDDDMLAPRAWSFRVAVAPAGVVERLRTLRTALVWHAMAS